MNRILTSAAGLLILALIGYWYHDQTERRQRSAEAMRTELAEFLTANGARYGALTYNRDTNSVTATDISWTQETGGMARHLTLKRAEIVAGDIDAFRTVFGSASYAPSEARVNQFLRLATAIDLRGLEMTHAEGIAAVTHLHLDAPAMRQLGFTPSRAGLERAGAAFVASDLAAALTFRRGRLEGLRLGSAEVPEFTLATLDLGPFESGSIGQLAVNGLALKSGGQTAQVEGLAFNGLALQRWLDALQAGQLTFGEGWLSALPLTGGQSPTFDAVKILGFKLAVEELGLSLSVEEASLTDLVRLGEFVAAGNLNVSGLEFPVHGNAPWSEALRDMGYESLRVNVVSRSTYDPNTKVSETEEFLVEVENAGRIFGSSRLQNVEIGEELRELDLNGLVSGGGIDRILGTWKLARLEVGYEDLSLIERAYEQALQRLGKTPDMVVDDYMAQLEELRSRYGNGPFLTQLSEQMRNFLEEPNSIVFRMVPPEPVVLAQVALAGFKDPEDLAKTLGLTVKANAAPD